MNTKSLSTPATLRSSGEADRSAMVRKETLANTIITVIVAIVVTWLIFRNRSAIPLFESPPGGAFGIVPGTFNFTLLVTLILTLVVRGRVQKGRIERGETRSLAGYTRLMPRNVVLRAFGMACVMSLIFLPITFGLLWISIRAGITSPVWSLPGVETLFAVHFALLSVVVTSLVVAGGLRD